MGGQAGIIRSKDLSEPILSLDNTLEFEFLKGDREGEWETALGRVGV